jgi:hypothetical protein
VEIHGNHPNAESHSVVCFREKMVIMK